MVKEFLEALKDVMESDEYKKFKEDYPTYYLVHGFLQLDQNYKPAKDWQIGYYCKDNDNLGVFATEPVKQLPFEEAFKDGGIISELKETQNLCTTEAAINTVKEIMQEDYKGEIPNSFIIILQVAEDLPIYNITVVTAAFSMITIKINAKTGESIAHVKRSILDLKKGE